MSRDVCKLFQVFIASPQILGLSTNLLFSPLRVFLPISLVFFTLGFGYMVYTIIDEIHVTNTSVLLITASAVLFLFGLLSEQIAALRFERTGQD